MPHADWLPSDPESYEIALPISDRRVFAGKCLS